MYELIILSRLMRGPAHGYWMAKIINNVIGPFSKLSNGRFYPLLTKLEQDSLIVPVPFEEGEAHGSERNARRYAITPAGQERFRHLMLDTSIQPGDHQRVFRFKVTSLDLLKPEERLRMIDHYLHYCDAHVFHTREHVERMQGFMKDRPQHCEPAPGLAENSEKPVLSDSELAAILGVLEHTNRLWTMETDWVRGLRAQQLEKSGLAHPLLSSERLPGEIVK